MQADQMLHIARIANLEGALCSLLRSAMQEYEPNEAPDSIAVTLDAEGLDIEYRRGGMPVGGEGV